MYKDDIEKYLLMVGGELESKGVVGKILILGGTVMVFRVGDGQQCCKL